MSRQEPNDPSNVAVTTLFFFVIAALALLVGLTGRAFTRRRRKTPEPKVDPVEFRARTLVAIRDLSAERGGGFVAAHHLVAVLGRSPGLPVVLESLLNEGLTEWGTTDSGGWGQRPTAEGYAHAAILESSKQWPSTRATPNP